MIRSLLCGSAFVAVLSGGACDPSSDCSTKLSVSAPGKSGAVVMVDGGRIGTVPVFSACIGEGPHVVDLVAATGERLNTAKFNSSAEDYVATFSDEYPGGAAIMTQAEFLRQQRKARQKPGAGEDN